MVNYELESTWKGACAAQFETEGSQRLHYVLDHLQFRTLYQVAPPKALWLINVYSRHKSCYSPSVMSAFLCIL